MTNAILVTSGEPAGIGPDLCLTLAEQTQKAPLVVLADPDLLAQRAEQLGLTVELVLCQQEHLPNQPAPQGQLYVLPLSMGAPCQTGVLNAANSAYVLAMLERSAQLCLTGQAAAVVTAPVQKSIINEAGIAFSGHTEFYQQQCNTEQVVMMLATEGLKVALATTHLPLKDVADAIDAPLLRRVMSQLVTAMQQDFGIARPRILVAGLNPHAGENGHLGHEELDTLIPVLKEFNQHECDLIGPLPADTLFTPKYLQQADAVLAMYHDQGLPVLKYLGFGQAVNITLGLPIIRTSVDHGTALDLAGTGQANPGSLKVAIDYALHMVQAREAAHA